MGRGWTVSGGLGLYGGHTEELHGMKNVRQYIGRT